MAIFSSAQAAQTIFAPPAPGGLNENLPDIKFRGTDCRSITVTLENSVVYKNSSNQKIKRRMQKIYRVESNTIHSISIEVKLEISTEGAVTENLDTVFRIKVDPHKRTDTPHSHPNSTSTSVQAPLPNPRFFIPRSVGTVTENAGSYEAYNLYLYNFKENNSILYKTPSRGTPTEKDSPEYYLDNNELIIECRKTEPAEKDPATGMDKTKWSFMTVASLLSDLLEKCPSFFLRLCIVGNYQFSPSTQTDITDEGGVDDFKFEKTGFLPTDGSPPTPAQSDLDTEAKWDQFLIARAKKLKQFVFGSRDLRIVTSPAIKITPTSGGDKILDEDWNYLATLFQLPNETPDIATLKSLKLEKSKFGAGSIFLWIIASLHDAELNFQTDRATVYPTATNNNGNDWATVAANNLASIQKLRKDLFFLVPGSSNTQFTTNLTGLSLRVEGYTDTVNDTTSNLTLSANRASSVIQELKNPTSGTLPPNVGGGIPGSKFNPTNGKGYGETRLSIPTPDETDERRNRRVLIRVVGITCT
jgi:hypothetical protein